MRTQLWGLVCCAVLTAPGTARAQSAAVAPAQLRVLQETAVVSVRDSRGATVALRIPMALHRGANHYRLYGERPLTLQSRERRRDLYRDVFLELATRSYLTPRTSVWDGLGKQVQWLASSGTGLRLPDVGLGAAPQGLEQAVGAALRNAAGLAENRNVSALLTELGRNAGGGTAEPLITSLQLRALATDQAEKRLREIGAALELQAAGTDPALREGYLAAAREFEEVRRGFWPALAAGFRKNQGRLLVSAVKDLALSSLGAWAIFGHLGWKSVEGVVNSEQRGQVALCYATVAAALAERSARQVELQPHALYAEYALDCQLSETLKEGQWMALKPAGGRTAGSWQIQLSGRCAELREALRN